jgi:hypothetical protein
MTNLLHGIILCAGEGTRFAESVGAKPPYPKHLEPFGDGTVLSRVVADLARLTPVTGITVTVNLSLQEAYLEELSRISKHTQVPLSYLVMYAPGLGGLTDRLVNKATHITGGETRIIGNVAVAPGDVIISGNDGGLLRSEVAAILEKIDRGRNAAVTVGGLGPFGCALYALDRTDLLCVQRASKPQIRIEAPGLRFWNINTIGDLREARAALGLT